MLTAWDNNLLILLAPLLGATIAGFFGRFIGNTASQWVTCAGLALACLLSWILFIDVAIQGGANYTLQILPWIASGDFIVNWSMRIDTLSSIMFIVVTSVSFLVHVYSIGYMHHDPHVPRFMAYLSLFTFMMLMLVSADDLVQLFFGWEGVGLASYLLIGFWFKKASANAASIKAFLVNRIGDIGFALGIFVIFWFTGSVQFDAVFAAVPALLGDNFLFLGWEISVITTMALLLFIGAMGKSAQFGLHVWLPDAMEGPTPVSALIHAATMVTAGVFMLARVSPLLEYSDTALNIIALTGAATAFFAATVGLTQNDIKRVIAYSTCSQLGYMVFAIGVSAYPAAMFHLTTHAFFKALLFLGAGSVIHAMSDEQDMRKMGGIYKMIPFTYFMMWIGSLALAGVPFFAGYYSKDIILEAAFGAHSTVGLIAFALGIAAALMTAFYSWRLILMTFHGNIRADEKVIAHVHESPYVMTVPLGLLALGAIISGFLLYPYFVGDDMMNFWGDSILILDSHQALEAAHHSPLWVKLLPIVVGLLGIALAYYIYASGKQTRAATMARILRPFYALSYNKWYIDELYNVIFIRPTMRLGLRFWQQGDRDTIDRLGPDGISKLSYRSGQVLGSLQSGYLYHYAFAMLIGVALLVSLYLWHGV